MVDLMSVYADMDEQSALQALQVFGERRYKEYLKRSALARQREPI